MRTGESKLGDILQGEFQSNPNRVIPFVLTDEEVRIAELSEFVAKNDRRRWLAASDELLRAEPIDTPLTEEERSKAIETANKRKYLKTAHIEAMDAGSRIRSEREADMVKSWDAVRFLRLMRDNSLALGSKLYEGSDKLNLIKAICFRLSKDPRYETELGFSFRKGLIFRGSPGMGKSYIPKLVADNPVCKIQILTMPRIIAKVRESGSFTEMNFGDHEIVYFDDIGTEFEAGEGVTKYMGSTINWFKGYIEDFYALYPQMFHRLMFSTNDNFDKLEAKYGYRVRSRLAQMFDVIDITGKDMRR